MLARDTVSVKRTKGGTPMSERVMKIDRNDKSILIRALHAQYRERKAKGKSYTEIGQLILRIDATAPGRLCLGMTNTCWQGMPSMTCATSALPAAVTPMPPTRPLPICCAPKCRSISSAICAELPSISCQGSFPWHFYLIRRDVF